MTQGAWLAHENAFTEVSVQRNLFDADIVILGDLADIFARALRLKMSAAECKSHVTAKDMDMEGKPCAAVPYCHQKHGNSVHRSGTRSKEIEPPM